jgi:hypothetical protein
LNNTLQQNTLEPIYRLAALFARRAKADISARGTKRVKYLQKVHAENEYRVTQTSTVNAPQFPTYELQLLSLCTSVPEMKEEEERFLTAVV